MTFCLNIIIRMHYRSPRIILFKLFFPELLFLIETFRVQDVYKGGRSLQVDLVH